MRDLELLERLRQSDAACVDQITHCEGQVNPTLEILNSWGQPVCLPDGVHINHAVRVLERYDLLIEKELTPRAKRSSDETVRMLDNPNLRNFEVSILHGQLADVSNDCLRWKISTNRLGNRIKIARYERWLRGAAQ
tara:strand:- start:48 stop:455 length:408 start_codon:yes stop_codon:yes gene_type:complete